MTSNKSSDQVASPVTNTLSSIGPTIGQISLQHSRPERPSQPRMLRHAQDWDVPVVVEHRIGGIPPDDDGVTGAEADAYSRLEALRPSRRRPHRRARPIHGPGPLSHLAAAGEKGLIGTKLHGHPRSSTRRNPGKRGKICTWTPFQHNSLKRLRPETVPPDGG
jgi:hypothetical protein